MASSKTLERPVSWRVLAGNLRRKVVRVWREGGGRGRAVVRRVRVSWEMVTGEGGEVRV